ncbi:MAG: hypothetical protein KVP17_000963 [Porospora cf. gigantea B]|uniref:uncharacterized protein n=1 Tax=Porospora cf. gigantea B TaxID=2853592 RepID=UPI003571B1C8|nr:MAG: hypothetical protein KVP17_000963 [Porospora cf. gigantea B]
MEIVDDGTVYGGFETFDDGWFQGRGSDFEILDDGTVCGGFETFDDGCRGSDMEIVDLVYLLYGPPYQQCPAGLALPQERRIPPSQLPPDSAC